MAVTPVGNPYVESSDLVANYPGASEALAERIDIVGVNPFADSAARATAIPSPTEGMMSSLNDTDSIQRYDGATWKPVGGKVLQVVMGSTTTQVTITSGTYTDTNLTATITPSSATSKILILLTQYYNAYSLSRTANMNYRILRDATVIATWQESPYMDVDGGTSVQLENVRSINWLDSPATASAITYKTQGSMTQGTLLVFQQSSRPAQIILIEVAV